MAFGPNSALHSEKSNPYRVLIQLAWPAMLSQVSQTLVGMVDTLMMGQTGNVNALAASALANNFLSVPIVFIVGLSYAATPKVAERFAMLDFNYCRKILKNSFLNNFFWCLCLCGFLWLITPFAYLLQVENPVLDLAIPFFYLVIFSLPGIALFQSFRQFYDGLGRTKPGMVASLLANLLNVGLNYFLIFGNAGFPELGLMGAGIANFVSRWIMGISLWIYFLRDPNSAEWRKKKSIKPDFQFIKLLNSLGFPIAFQFLFEVGAFTATALLVGSLGAESLSAHQIVVSMAAMTYMLASGISTAASVRVGHFLGLKDFENIKKSGIQSILLTLVVMGCTALFFIFCRHQIPLWFIGNEKVVQLSSSLFLVAALFQISDGLQVVGLGCLRGLSDVKIPTLFTFIAYWLIAIPVSYLLGMKLHLGLQGTWIGLLTGLSVSAIFMLFRFFAIVQKKGPFPSRLL
jgi:MATE family multidrug resistance protein